MGRIREIREPGTGGLQQLRIVAAGSGRCVCRVVLLVKHRPGCGRRQTCLGVARIGEEDQRESQGETQLAHPGARNSNWRRAL